MEKLHPLQEKIYNMFKKNKNALPSFRAIAKEIGVSSTNTVAYHIKELRQKGYLSIHAVKQDIVPLSLRSILHLEGRGGVYVLLKNNKPFFVGEADDMKRDLTRIINNPASCAVDKIKESVEEIYMAFHLVDDEEERKNTYQYLVSHYKDSGNTLCEN